VVTGTPRLAHHRAAAEFTRQLQPVAIARERLNWPGSAVVIPHLRERVNPDVKAVRPDGPTFDEAFADGAPLRQECWAGMGESIRQPHRIVV
jgi:hypothetical protein